MKTFFLMKDWKLKEIVLMSILGVVFAVVYLLFYFFGQNLRNLLTPFGLGPFGYEIIFGIWFIVSIVAMYIIRKPGAALWSEIIAAVVQVLMGSPAGPRLIIAGIIQGLGAEAAFALTKYKDFRLRVLILAGILAAVFSFIWGWFVSGFAALSIVIVGAMLIVRIISGALLAGVLGKWVSDQLLKTGVLRGYALGKERQKQRDIN